MPRQTGQRGRGCARPIGHCWSLREASLPVRPADTPAEYGGRLSSGVPGTAEHLGLLTGLYVVARYSHHDVGEGEADAAYQHAATLASKLEDARAGNDSDDD